jgi:hypothetical protein
LPSGHYQPGLRRFLVRQAASKLRRSMVQSFKGCTGVIIIIIDSSGSMAVGTTIITTTTATTTVGDRG